jgi:hypothetical protein
MFLSMTPLIDLVQKGCTAARGLEMDSNDNNLANSRRRRWASSSSKTKLVGARRMWKH